MSGYVNVPMDLRNDNDLIGPVQWFATKEEVFKQLRLMAASGWRITPMGLVSEGENGPVVARPIKIKGQQNYTGIGVWKFSGDDADNY